MNIIAFYENLLADFQEIKVAHQLSDKATGIKFGIAMGPAVVGFIGKDQSYFTANGPDVNLASRLCAEAGPDELFVGSRVWYVLKHHLTGWNAHEFTIQNIKGFEAPVPVVRISHVSSREKTGRFAEHVERNSSLLLLLKASWTFAVRMDTRASKLLPLRPPRKLPKDSPMSPTRRLQ